MWPKRAHQHDYSYIKEQTSTRHQTYEVSKETPKNWKTKSAAQRAVTELCIMRGMDPDDNKLFVIEEVIDESKGDDIL